MAQLPFKCHSKQISDFAKANKLHKNNQANLIQKGNFENGALLVFRGGSQQYFYNTDVELLFQQESYFHYLFGVQEPDCYGAIFVQEGLQFTSTLFIQKEDEQAQEFYLAKYGQSNFDNVMLIDEFQQYVSSLPLTKIYLNKGNHPFGQKPNIIPEFEFPKSIQKDNLMLNKVLQQCRSKKNEIEVQILQQAINLTCEAQIQIMQMVQPGLYEYQLAAEFNKFGQSYGNQFQSFPTIVGSGPRSAILHYFDNTEIIPDQSLVLVDSGIDVYGYKGDITSTFPSNGTFNLKQKQIYEIVYNANQQVQKNTRSGQQIKVLNNIAYNTILNGLIEVEIIRKDIPIQTLKNSNVVELFMPHYIGHNLGLDNHDVGSTDYFRKLETGDIFTVEPGIYFTDYCINQAINNYSEFINQEILHSYIGFGGVRIEDDVLVQENNCVNLSGGIIPRTVKEIEACIAKTEWKQQELL